MPLPDLIGAIVAYGRLQAAITTLTSNRFSAERKESWNLPAYAVVVNGPRGGPPVESPRRRARVDLECYGPDSRTSKVLAETVISVFAPDFGPSAVFTLANTQVGEIAKETEPIWLPDRENGWPRTIVPLLFTYTGVDA